ncbi:MAG: FAD-dependent oxidoreductase [bacterium]
MNAPSSTDTGGIETDALIIGGGIAGLTTAVALAREGLETVIVEKKSILGGRARSWTDDKTGDPIHIGPHIFTSEYPNFLNLQDVIDARGTIVWQNDPFLHMVDGQKKLPKRRSNWIPTPFKYVPSEMQDNSYSSKSLWNNLIVLAYVLTMDDEDLEKLDRINAYAFLKAMGVDDPFIDNVWRFSCRSIMNMPLEMCSAAALFRFYRMFVGYSDYDVGFPDGGLGDTFVPQSREHLEEHGGNILMEREVQELLVDDGGVKGALLADGTSIRADYTVSAIPAKPLQTIVPREWERNHDYFGQLGHMEPCPYISPYIWFDRKLTDLKFWARSYQYEDLNTDFYDMSNIITDRKDQSSLITSNIIYSRRVADLSDEEIVEETVREISEFLPEAKGATVEHSVVNRIPLAIHCPYPGVESRRVNQESPIDGLYVAGDWTDTNLPSSMEGAAKSGWMAGEAILEQENITRDLVMPQREIDGMAYWIKQFGQRPPFKQIRKWLPVADLPSWHTSLPKFWR